jgi:hypothetical protein
MIGDPPMHRLAIFFLCTPCVLFAQLRDASPKPEAAQAESSSPILPAPTMGWVLDRGTEVIFPAFGQAPLLAAGHGPFPGEARDGAGNIDGPALLGAMATGETFPDYVLDNPSDVSHAAGTTVMLLCGRVNNWLPANGGGLLAIEAAGRWNVDKPGEWGLSLVSSISPFAVKVDGKWVYAKQAPTPGSFARFGPVYAFPPPLSNTPVCVWAFYDTSVSGSTTAPEISVAYDDGPASAPVVLDAKVGLRGIFFGKLKPMQINFGGLGADLGMLFIWQGAAAERLFQHPVRRAYWNGGLRSSIASGFQTPPWSELSVTKLNPHPIALGGDAQDNVRALPYPSFTRTTAFAHYSVTTAPGTPFLAVRYQLGNVVEAPQAYSVSFAVDGHSIGYDQPWTYGTNYRSIPLPQDGNSHTLDLRNGFARSNGNYAAPDTGSFGGGGFIDAVAVPKGYSLTVNHPVPASVAVVFSHSVATADDAGTAPYEGQGAQSSVAWPVLARAAKAFGTEGVVDESFGGELMANNCWTLAECNAYIAKVKTAQPNIALGFVAQMHNDFEHGPAAYGECLPQYEQTLTNFIRTWSALLPDVPLYVGSDTLESAKLETWTDGCSPALLTPDWRNGIESTVEDYASSNNAAWLHFVDMTPWLPQSEITSNGLHPTVKGHILICQAVAAYFRQPVTCGVPQ